MARPCLRTSQPMPPPRVRPAMPTLPVSPNGVARPWAAAATVYSPARRPGWAQARRRSGSMCRPFIAPRSRTMPPSRRAVAGQAVRAAADGQLQAGLAGEHHGPRDIPGDRRLDDEHRPLVEAGVVDLAGLVVGRVLRPDRRPGDAGDERGDVVGTGGSWGGDAGQGHVGVPFGVHGGVRRVGALTCRDGRPTVGPGLRATVGGSRPRRMTSAGATDDDARPVRAGPSPPRPSRASSSPIAEQSSAMRPRCPGSDTAPNPCSITRAMPRSA